MKLGILCTITNSFGRKGFYNGQEIGLGKALAARGHTVIIYKSALPNTAEETAALSNRLTIQYIHLPHIGVHGYFSCEKYLDPGLEGILCFSDHQIFLPHVIRYCEKHRIPFVPYVGTAKSQDTGTLHGFVMDRLFSMGTLRYYRRAPAISKTEAVRKDLLGMGVRQVAVAGVGIDGSLLNPDFRKADRAALRREFGFQITDRVICCVGKLVEVKQPLRLIALMRLFVEDDRRKKGGATDLKMLIVGEGDLKDQVLARIREYGLEDNVRQIDRIPYGDMWKVYTMADYFLNVSRQEVFGMAVLEAIYYETAVAAAPASGPLVILQGMEGHRICRSDQEFLAFIQEEHIPAKTLTEMSQRVLSRFSWDVCADRFLEILNNTPRVIVNSDDFGMTVSCTDAIGQAFREGLITDTTLVSNGEAFRQAVQMAKEGGFADRVGVHFVLTSGAPLTAPILSCRRLTKNGQFTRLLKHNAAYFLPLSKKEKEAIYVELTAQAAKIKQAGLPISHADSHHHIHMNFQVAPIVARVCAEQGIGRLRCHQNLKYRSPARRWLFEGYNRWLRTRGFATPDYFEEADRYQRLSYGISEIMVHADFDPAGRLIDRKRQGQSPELKETLGRLGLSEEIKTSYSQI